MFDLLSSRISAKSNVSVTQCDFNKGYDIV